MDKIFNTSGPINPEDHYCIPPLERWNLAEILTLIEQKKYFILHAPRQTGKTSSLLALQDYLNVKGKYFPVYLNVETAQACREDYLEGMKSILQTLVATVDHPFPGKYLNKLIAKNLWSAAFLDLFNNWCRHLKKPLVLFIDEIDSLIGDTLISVLRQIRAGYPQRPEKFPQSIILCGVRDIKDYRIHSSANKEIITGGSAFNIKAESLRLGNLTRENVFALLRQHTQETGQFFEAEAIERTWELTLGQPWLVNALAHQVTYKNETYRDRTKKIPLQAVVRAKEDLILSRASHLDQLADKLKEERVRRVIQPILAGVDDAGTIPPDDVSYCQDLGLITLPIAGARLSISNPIYQEVIPRELTWSDEMMMVTRPTPFFLEKSGKINISLLLSEFQRYFRQHSEAWIDRFFYKEAGFQLLLQAFLQRIINGGGVIEREYGLGRGRTVLIIKWPHSKGEQRGVIELKIRTEKDSLESVIKKGIKQVLRYADRFNPEEIHLMVFDKDPKKKWGSKIYRNEREHSGKTVTVWGV